MNAKGWTWPRTANARGILTEPSSSPLQTARRSLAFGGRSTRSELITYLFATLLISVPVSFITGLALARPYHLLITNALTVLLALPVPALLVRRLHDSGRSGAWVWLAIFGFAVWLARTLISAQLGLSARLDFDSWTWLLDWGVILANLGTVLLALLPGTTAPTRFGANPRQSVPGQPT